VTSSLQDRGDCPRNHDTAIHNVITRTYGPSQSIGTVVSHFVPSSVFTVDSSKSAKFSTCLGKTKTVYLHLCLRTSNQDKDGVLSYHCFFGLRDPATMTIFCRIGEEHIEMIHISTQRSDPPASYAQHKLQIQQSPVRSAYQTTNNTCYVQL
jgi:hypothetical protein